MDSAQNNWGLAHLVEALKYGHFFFATASKP
jgi:hypothetical protein